MVIVTFNVMECPWNKLVPFIPYVKAVVPLAAVPVLSLKGSKTIKKMNLENSKHKLFSTVANN